MNLFFEPRPDKCILQIQYFKIMLANLELDSIIIIPITKRKKLWIRLWHVYLHTDWENKSFIEGEFELQFAERWKEGIFISLKMWNSSIFQENSHPLNEMQAVIAIRGAERRRVNYTIRFVMFQVFHASSKGRW